MIKVIKKSKHFILFCLLMTSSLAFSQGSRYTGAYKKSEPIEYTGKKTVVIEGLEFSSTNSRAAITLWRCDNVIIRNCKFKDLKTKVAIYAENSTNINVIDCSFENVYGAFLAAACGENIKFDHNDVKNVIGFLYGGTAKSAAVQFNGVNGPNSSVSYNCIENIPGESSPEDNINMYKTNGTSDSPILIKSNWIRGGGPNLTSGGITLGDFGGSYVIAEDNILVNPGQGGMGTAGGHDIIFRNNKVYSKQQSFTNVGLVIANFTPEVSGRSYNITSQNNEVNWTHRDGFINNFWTDNKVENVKGIETNIYNPDLNESILPDQIINRARTNKEDKPEDKPEIVNPEDQITEVYADKYNRISIKCFACPIPSAFADVYTSAGVRIASTNITRFRTLIDRELSAGDYLVKVTYGNPIKTETKEITIK